MAQKLTDLKNKFDEIPDLIFISAKEQMHLDGLKQKMISLTVDEQHFGDWTIVTNVRHYDSLLKTNDALDDILTAVDSGISKELLASDIRRALNYLEEITLVRHSNISLQLRRLLHPVPDGLVTLTVIKTGFAPKESQWGNDAKN